MSFTIETWNEIASFPVCPVQALEEALVDKDLTEKDISKIDKLIEELKEHENDLRVLRQEIERRVRLLKMDRYSKSVKK